MYFYLLRGIFQISNIEICFIKVEKKIVTLGLVSAR